MVMYALMTFPSTCFDALTCVTGATYAALNRKRRVRQAALDVLAILGHIAGTRSVLELVQPIANSRDDGDSLLAAIKARLSRKQLPLLTAEGTLEFGNSSAHLQPTQQAVSIIILSPQSIYILFPVYIYTYIYIQNYCGFPQGDDMDWISAGSGSVPLASLRRRSQATRSNLLARYNQNTLNRSWYVY